MNASFEWLRAFVPTRHSAAELAEVLTMRCATVEELHPLRLDLAPFVVARIVETAPHPDAERLSVNKVDAGDGELTDVVCGAPNVRAGALYPFARVGTSMPGGITIERRKIRGAVSAGMLCSARELGLGEDHEGILELNVDVAPGTPLLDALQIGDVKLVIDVLPNRPDLFSHLGIAREIAAADGIQVTRPAELGGGEFKAIASLQGRGELSGSGVTVRVEDESGCSRYMAAVVRGVRVGPSPDWLVQRLAGVGTRSINNVVDITNYCLHAFGQPMHAFDLARLGNTVVVRQAAPGETVTTLDGVDRVAPEGSLLIADTTRGVAFAGIMGGADTEVVGETRDILLEVATFDAKQVRRTRRAIGLSTDASQRFERGVDPEITPLALSEAVRLLESLAGGALDGKPLDVRVPRTQPQPVSLRPLRVRQILGVDIPAAECDRLLSSIGFRSVAVAGSEDGAAGVGAGRGRTDPSEARAANQAPTTGTGGSPGAAEVLHFQAPTWRTDALDEIDLVEEVARLHGYEVIPFDPPPRRASTVPTAPQVSLTDRLRRVLAAAGLYEVRPLPFVSEPADPAVRVRNPLAENEAFLRTRVLDTLARRAEYNLAQKQGNVRIFEIGPTFAPGKAGERPYEDVRVALLIMGERQPAHFTDSAPPIFDEWDAKGLAELLLSEIYPEADATLVDSERGTLWEIRVGGTLRGEVRRVALDAPVWASPAFGVELAFAEDTGVLMPEVSRGHVRFRSLPAYPSAEFDLALLVPDALAAVEVERAMRLSLGDLLESVQLFDEFRGSGVPEGVRSLAWRLVLRHRERTLRDKEIDGRRRRLLDTLARELDVHPRA